MARKRQYCVSVALGKAPERDRILLRCFDTKKRAEQYVRSERKRLGKKTLSAYRMRYKIKPYAPPKR